jgi:hypothetical protein
MTWVTHRKAVPTGPGTVGVRYLVHYARLRACGDMVTNGLAVWAACSRHCRGPGHAGPAPGNRSGISPGPILEVPIEVMTRYCPA